MLCLLENEQGESLISMLCFRQEAGGYPLTDVIAVEGRQLALCCSILLQSAVQVGSWGRRVDWILC